MSITIFRRVPVLLALLVTMSLMALVPGVFAQTVNTVELVGAIESMSLNTITVNQQSIDISAAEINTPLEIGAVVKIEGTLNEDGTIAARQVNPVATGIQPGEAELIGVLESLAGTTMVVDGQTIDVSAAEIGQGVEVGQTVKVHATANSANTWQAREVEVFEPGGVTPPQPTDSGEFEVTGTLESIGSGFIVVSGQPISITGAEFHDPLLLGTLVKVHVSLVNGQLAAREIENAVTEDDNANTNDNLNSNDNTNNENLNSNENANENDNTSANTAISAQQAIDTVLQVYPNTTIRSIELTTKFGGTPVWEVKIGNRIELSIDATTGAILTIDRPGDDDNQNANANENENSNDNNDDNSGMGSDDNSNQNENSNDNNDDNGGDDNGGGGSDDSGGDDNGGDDNGGMG